MFRPLGLVLTVVGALALVPTALAAYPSPFAAQGGEGLTSKDGSLRYVAFRAGANTSLRAIRTSDGSVAMSHTVKGSFGIPMLTQNGPGGGLFRDGRTFVLQSTGYGPATTFQLIGTGDLTRRDSIALKGTFAYDALSPDGSRLYLIQHSSSNDLQHYVVRAYDLKAHALLPGRIADKTQKGWVMQGFAAARTTTANGRWAYTLYMNPGGYPFVHALDTVKGVAHCVGFAWPSSTQGLIFDFKLAVSGKKLMVRQPDGALWRVIDRTTWKVTRR